MLDLLAVVVSTDHLVVAQGLGDGLLGEFETLVNVAHPHASLHISQGHFVVVVTGTLAGHRLVQGDKVIDKLHYLIFISVVWLSSLELLVSSLLAKLLISVQYLLEHFLRKGKDISVTLISLILGFLKILVVLNGLRSIVIAKNLHLVAVVLPLVTGVNSL